MRTWKFSHLLFIRLSHKQHVFIQLLLSIVYTHITVLLTMPKLSRYNNRNQRKVDKKKYKIAKSKRYRKRKVPYKRKPKSASRIARFNKVKAVKILERKTSKLLSGKNIKYTDVTTSGGPKNLDQAGVYIGAFENIVAGYADKNNAIGSYIRPVAMSLELEIKGNSVSDTFLHEDIARVMVVEDIQPTGLDPQWQQVLAVTTANADLFNTGPRNKAYVPRYKVLYDECYDYTTPTTKWNDGSAIQGGFSGASPSLVYQRINLNLKKMGKITSRTPIDLQLKTASYTKGLYVMIFNGTDTAATSRKPIINYHLRTYYYDE